MALRPLRTDPTAAPRAAQPFRAATPIRPDATPDAQAACPLLGLTADRNSRWTRPVSAHRCYINASGPTPVSHQQQVQFCISPDYGNCAALRQASGVLALEAQAVRERRRAHPADPVARWIPVLAVFVATGACALVGTVLATGVP